ncbi:MAG: carnitine dehydratase [Syntrophomonadaceae bacterium]|jgi:L-carnitine CoA-transferase|nr:carnitine dehydratase [Syntrophomonadaceae bacterium]
MRMTDVPSFGNLEGLTVVCMGNTIAAPFAAELMAEHGACVIYVENTDRPDIGRVSLCPYGFITEHRNELFMAINLKNIEGEQVFIEILKKTDILIEGLKGGTFTELGLSDKRLWAENEKLVIVHVSGFGESGLAEYLRRPSYDPIGQAAGGFMSINGFPEPSPPLRAPFVCDYYTALFACWSALAAQMGAQRTGVGESVDVSQMEVMWKLQYGYPLEYFYSGVVHPRQGNEERDYICFGTYLCGNGRYVFICCIANGPARGLLKVLGKDNDPTYPENIQLFRRGDVAAEKVETALKQYCLDNEAEKVEKELNANGVPCSFIHDIETIQTDPQALERGLFTEWSDDRFGKLKGVNIVPKMSNRPGMFWGGARDHGADNRDILSELGYTDKKIEELYKKGVLAELRDGGYFASKAMHIKNRDQINIIMEEEKNEDF